MYEVLDWGTKLLEAHSVWSQVLVSVLGLPFTSSVSLRQLLGIPACEVSRTPSLLIFSPYDKNECYMNGYEFPQLYQTTQVYLDFPGG